MSELKAGMRLSCLRWDCNDPQGDRVDVGKYNCLSITVTEENGGLGFVMWARVEFVGSRDVEMYNLNSVQAVGYSRDSEVPDAQS